MVDKILQKKDESDGSLSGDEKQSKPVFQILRVND